jgi:2-polyprenyl-3-methyl-5-hydroxy-6-metoxy-1,4-benzoquinol methylase
MNVALSCTVCGGATRLERALPDVDVHRCLACDHCFSDLSRAPTKEVYGPEYYVETHRNWFENPNIELFETIHRSIFSANKDAAILDVGCGKGDLLKYLHSRNPRYSLTGIDLSPNPPIAGISILRGDIMNHKFERRYDAIVSLAAIEHLDDVHGFVRQLRELCVPGGQVIIMTLNDRSILYAVGRMLARVGWQGPVVRLYDKHHLNHFNVRSLERLVTEEGLKVDRTLLHNAPLAAIDFPASSRISDFVQRTGVWATFVLGKSTGRTYLQTVVSRRV